MPDNVFLLSDYIEHTISEVICIKCGYRCISVRPSTVLLKTIQCTKCCKTGFIINTRQSLEKD